MSRRSLLDLPPHVIGQVASFCSRSALCVLARSHTSLRDTAERLIWSDLYTFDDVKVADLSVKFKAIQDYPIEGKREERYILQDWMDNTLAGDRVRIEWLKAKWTAGLHARPCRLPWVQSLKVGCDEDWDAVSSLMRVLLMVAPHVEELILRTPPWLAPHMCPAAAFPEFKSAVFPNVRRLELPVGWFPGWQDDFTHTLAMLPCARRLEFRYEPREVDCGVRNAPLGDVPVMHNLEEIHCVNLPLNRLPHLEQLVAQCPAVRRLSVVSLKYEDEAAFKLKAVPSACGEPLQRFQQLQRIDWIEPDGKVSVWLRGTRPMEG